MAFTQWYDFLWVFQGFMASKYTSLQNIFLFCSLSLLDSKHTKKRFLETKNNNRNNNNNSNNNHETKNHNKKQNETRNSIWVLETGLFPVTELFLDRSHWV